MGKTKQQLINEWLSIYPADVGHPDLEFNAVSGRVEMKNGMFLIYKEYAALKGVREIV